MKHALKFDLPINGGVVRDLEGLRRNFTIEILGLHASGLLLKWVARFGEPELEQKLLGIGKEHDSTVLRALADALGTTAPQELERQADGLPPLAANGNEAACKERIPQLEALLDDLKSKNYCLTQLQYDQFVKRSIDIDLGCDTYCMTFDDALFSALVPTGRYVTFSGKGLHPKAVVAMNQGFRFVFHKEENAYVRIGDPLGRVYIGNDQVGIEIKSPFKGKIVAYAGREEHNGRTIRLDRPVCYVDTRDPAAMQVGLARWQLNTVLKLWAW